MDPAQVVLVAEDEPEPDESAQVYEALRMSALYEPPRGQGARVIVGVCSIALKPGSPHIGSFYTSSEIRCKVGDFHNPRYVLTSGSVSTDGGFKPVGPGPES